MKEIVLYTGKSPIEAPLSWKLKLSLISKFTNDSTYHKIYAIKRRLHRLIRVYTCQNATLLEITCRGLIINLFKSKFDICDDVGITSSLAPFDYVLCTKVIEVFYNLLFQECVYLGKQRRP